MKMKKFVALFLALVLVFALAACVAGTESTESSDSAMSSQSSSEASRTSAEPQEQNSFTTPSGAEKERDASGETPREPADSTASEPAGSKILVAYFSATNNTEGVAQKLADGLDADLYEITPEQPYTEADLDYGDRESRSSVEMNDTSARPAISGTVANMERYDVVFVGYPIWWGEAPRIMSTFIESYDFSEKTLVAFCTSASSGFGSSDKALRSAENGATWLDGHRFSAGASAEDVMAWANGLGMG